MNEDIERAIGLAALNKLDLASQALEHILARDPDNTIARHQLALVYFRQGNYQHALDLLCAIPPEGRYTVQTLALIARAHQLMGNHHKAEIHYIDALKIDPDHVESLNNLAMLYASLNRTEEATAPLTRALSIKPGNSELWFNYGNLLRALGDTPKAITAYRKAAKLDGGNAKAAIYNNLANTLLSTGAVKEAIQVYLSILELDANNIKAIINLAKAYLSNDNGDRCRKLLKRALDLDPDNPSANTLLGRLFCNSLEYTKGIMHFRRALKRQPGDYHIYHEISRAFLKMGDVRQGILFAEKVCHCDPAPHMSQSSLYYLYAGCCDFEKQRAFREKLQATIEYCIEHDTQPPINCLEHLIFSEDYKSHYGVARLWNKSINRRISGHSKTFIHNKHAGERLTVGYISSDFNNHAVSYLSHKLFELHNRDRFTIHAYSTSRRKKNHKYARYVREHSDMFFDLSMYSDADSAKLIHDNGVDILVDLNGHAPRNRLGLIALRPAPIQINYLGYIGTTGLDCIDYNIVDGIVVPHELSNFYSECLIYLPDCYQINSHSEYGISNNLDRADYDLPRTGFVFCSFNQAQKITPDIFDAWLDILRHTPGSVLWLVEFNGLMVENIRRYASKSGVDPARLIFSKPTSTHDEYMSRYKLADVALDTNIYNGGTVTADALWQEIPVITLQGQCFSSRMASSLLINLGMEELVASSMKEYIQLAISLARDPVRLAHIQATLRRNKKTFPLFRTDSLVDNLESAYIRAYQHFREGRKPENIFL